jgi:hypothetical protein
MRFAGAEPVFLAAPTTAGGDPFRALAQRALCAAAIFLRAAALILLRLRPVGLDFPAYTFTKAASAAFNPDNSRSTRSRSFFNCWSVMKLRFTNP